MSTSIFAEKLPSDGISMMLHEWTKHYRGIPTAASTDPAVGVWDQWLQGEGIALPDCRDLYQSALRTNWETLQRRRSIRIYGERPFTLDDLAQLFTLAYPVEADPHAYDRAHAAHWDISLTKIAFLALNIEGLEKGAYLYDRQTHAVYPLRVEDPTALVHEVCFQAEFTLAPLILLMSSSLHNVINRYGDRGYRYMLMETGMILQRLYLVTSYLGMSGSVSGSFIFGDLENWLGYDSFNQTLLLTFVVGHLPTQPA